MSFISKDRFPSLVRLPPANAGLARPTKSGYEREIARMSTSNDKGGRGLDAHSLLRYIADPRLYRKLATTTTLACS